MNKSKEERILQLIRIVPVLAIFVITLIIIVIFYFQSKNSFENEKSNLENKYFLENSNRIKYDVNRAYTHITNIQKNTENELKESIKSRVYEAHSIANSIYEKYKNSKSKEEILDIIKTALDKIRFNDGRGYFFLDDIKGNKILIPNKEEEGKNFLEHRDDHGYSFVKTIVKTIEEKSERFDEYYWENPTTKKSEKKVAFYKYFEPFDLAIGSGEYFNEYQKLVQQKALDYIEIINSDKNSNIFVLSNDGVCLTENSKNLQDIEIDKLEILKKVKENYAENILNAIKSGDDFIRYKEEIDKSNIEYSSNRITYIKAITKWNWIIGSSFYENDVNLEIIDIKEKLENEYEDHTKNIILIALIISLIFMIASRYVSKFVENKFQEYKQSIKDSESILYQQTKMATMGEMIGNIAHQFRQPLSTITTASSGMVLLKQYGNLSDEEFFKNNERINNSAKYLSQTIEDFRNFFNPNFEKGSFKISDTFEKTLDFLKAQLFSKDIFIVQNIKDIEINSYENDLIQVLINILNNARDELIKKDYPKYIFIDAAKIGKNLEIHIKDNAGGISNEYISNVFDAYFTTKDKNKGTGIGLYMCKELVEKRLDGTIEVKNEEFTYNKNDYKGAVFIIKIKLREC